MSLPKQADAISPEMQFGGLPKGILAWRGAVNGFTAGIWNRTYYDQIVYNYGGYTYGTYVGAVWSDIIIPEPGVYDLSAQAMFAAGVIGGVYYSAFWINGLQTVPYTQPNAVPSAAGGPVITQCNQPQLLKQGDAVSYQTFLAGVPNTVDQAGYTWFGVTKRGGQY